MLESATLHEGGKCPRCGVSRPQPINPDLGRILDGIIGLDHGSAELELALGSTVAGRAYF